MRLKELRGLPVIDPAAARKVGTVTDYQVDPVAGRVAALDIGSTESGEPQRILGHRIRRVGRHAVILTGRANASPSVVPELNDHWLDAGSLVGLEVMGDDGNSIGALIDGAFNQDSLEIDAYLLNGTLWEQLIGRRGRIEPKQVHSCSRELMLISSGRVEEVVEPDPAADEQPTTAMPLKTEDRLPTPSVESARDGQAVGSRTD
jgi:sporulation protein YlmC with PRC-barrel domain